MKDTEMGPSSIHHSEKKHYFGSIGIREKKRFPLPLLQSRPIEMRGTILYLAKRWTEFEMLLTQACFFAHFPQP